MKKQIFILAGQSNMSGRGGVHWSHGRYQWDGIVPEECAPSPCILRLSADLNWEEAKDPLHIDIESKSKTCGVGPGMSFANCVLKDMGGGGCTVGLVPCAFGGTAIKEWEKGSKLYNQMVHRAKEAAEIRDGDEIKAVLWYQGESDTDSDHASEVYSGNLKKFIEDVRSDLGLPYLPFIQVALASGSGSKNNINKVRKAQLALELPNLVCVDAMGLPLNSDHLHLTTNAQVKLGKMLAEAYITHFSVKSSSTTLFIHQLIMSPKAADQRNKYINKFFLNSYWRNRGATLLVVGGLLLLYMVFIYCY